MIKEKQTDPEFVGLLIDHQEVLRSFVHSLIPSHPDIRDLLQEINIVLWERRRTFTVGTNFGAWIHKVARYMVLNERRRLARGNWLMFNEELIDHLAKEEVEDQPDVFEEKRSALRHCLTRLSPEHQDLIKARYFSEENYDDYVVKKGRTRNSLRVTLCRLRSFLRRCIGQRLATGGEEA